VIGYIPADPALAMPERHLGLAGDAADIGRLSRALADAVAAHIDLDALLAIAASAPDLQDLPGSPRGSLPRTAIGASGRIGSGRKPVIAVARDEAFSFYYQDNLEALEAIGAELAFFSPLRDAALPPGTAAVYLGGGYPELRAAELGANGPMRSAIRAAADDGMPIYAECGGYLYLLDGIDDMAGEAHPGCGVLPGRARVGARLSALGYRDCQTLGPSLVGPAGSRLSGHVFHYAFVEGGGAPALGLRSPSRPEEAPALEGGARGSVFGSFLHVHFSANPALASRIVTAAARRIRTP
ncbi:MAG: cobyrinate a,c-diamide synthase, partial [Spirochaetes bacterium]|nr:cobyrinate a,c-diamide synthase [Spirochaetota bacterium]